MPKISNLAPAAARPPDVLGLDAESVSVTYRPGNGTGGFPEKFYVVYKEKGKICILKFL